ncbi:MAG: nucleotide sugar dehydrogenase, partial [Candidatus Aminicenantes bacterium]|nr:nucleotide sugar dehydrogenase [Candidatus Aminicenantes bacterium]
MKRSLINKIKSHDAFIGIIGLGYVGLPLVLRFAEEGFSVT